MHLDVQTLSVVTVFVTALLGALLVFAGVQNNSIRAPMWWGASYIIIASGLGLVTSRGAVPNFVTTDLANALRAFGLRSDLDRRPRLRRPQRTSALAARCSGGVDRALPRAGLRRRRQPADRGYLDHACGVRLARRRGIMAGARRAADVALAVGARTGRACSRHAGAGAGDAVVAGLCRRCDAAWFGVYAACLRHASVHRRGGIPAAQHDQGAYRA